MARPRDVLARFRPTGTPGSAAPAGVPADRFAELSQELAPVLDALAGVEAEAAEIRAAGERDASRLRREGEARLQALVEAGRSRAEADRSVALARARAAADTTLADAVDAARAESAAIDARVAERLPALVGRVLAAARAELSAAPGSTTGRP